MHHLRLCCAVTTIPNTHVCIIPKHTVRTVLLGKEVCTGSDRFGPTAPALGAEPTTHSRHDPGPGKHVTKQNQISIGIESQFNLRRLGICYTFLKKLN